MQTAAIFTISVMLGFAQNALGQKESLVLPHSSEDSSVLVLPGDQFSAPLGKGLFPGLRSKSFEALNPGAVKSHSNQLGTVYTMPQDNMAVLVPHANNDRMPGTGASRQQAMPENMPNPLYPAAPPARKRR
ncbi:MAG TPA: hypothetical protein VL307_01580 [Chitinophagaceae bacterium]|nr:hypothetical protein [Chitinophagaceae bacterium]